MEIKCNTYPINFGTRVIPDVGRPVTVPVRLKPTIGNGADKFVKRPDAAKSASGLSGFVGKVSKNIVEYSKSYKKNLKHTYDHKVVFAMIEKELYGKVSIDSVTHDLDKLVLYALGFPKSFVSKFHRKHSAHHVESGKKLNIYSMLCDNIASSPEFKPEKKLGLRDYYSKSVELQKVKGLKELLEKYNYGEDLDFDKIKLRKSTVYNGAKGMARFISRAAAMIAFTI